MRLTTRLRSATARRVLFAGGLLVGLGGALFLDAGCVRRSAGADVTRGAYGDSPAELQRLWSEVLQACQQDDRPRVHALLASFTMTQEELGELVGPATAQRLWARYQAMMRALANAGAVELVAHVYEKKYDDIAVTRIDTQPPAEQADSDRAVAQALVQKAPFYTIRVKHHNEAKGLRYDFFVYRNGFWRSGNLLGKYLEPAASAAPPAAAVQNH